MSVDCKELIEWLEAEKLRFEDREFDLCEILKSAATAIKTLLAEREAAVEHLRGRCDVCKHRRVCFFDDQRRIGCANSKRGRWEWRGPTPPTTEAENETK